MELLSSQLTNYFWSLKKGWGPPLKLMKFLHHSPDLDLNTLKLKLSTFSLYSLLNFSSNILWYTANKTKMLSFPQSSIPICPTVAPVFIINNNYLMQTLHINILIFYESCGRSAMHKIMQKQVNSFR